MTVWFVALLPGWQQHNPETLAKGKDTALEPSSRKPRTAHPSQPRAAQLSTSPGRSTENSGFDPKQSQGGPRVMADKGQCST